MTKQKIILIAAHDSNFAIGINGKIPWHYPEDLKFFKKTTLGFPIIMGRKTFESIGSKPLPGRPNIILSSTLQSQEGIQILDDPAKVFDLEFDTDKLFIVGGSAIYEYFLPFAEELYITEIKESFIGDTFFPNYKKDLKEKWVEVSREEHPEFSFIKYKSV
jgi:dihydrofolate reductase